LADIDLKTRLCDPDALLRCTRTGNPMNLSNVRRDIWLKLVARAGVVCFAGDLSRR
jgi:hypothetical protein